MIMEWWITPLLILIGILAIYLIGDWLGIQAHKASRERERETAYRKQETRKAEAQAKYNAEVDQLVPQYVNASFTRECARLILQNYQKNVRYCIDKRQQHYFCGIYIDMISLLNDSPIRFEANGYANLQGSVALEAFTKAIVRNLPEGFTFSKMFHESGGWEIRIQHDIPVPPLKSIANS